jgi:cell division septation protein DedD
VGNVARLFNRPVETPAVGRERHAPPAAGYLVRLGPFSDPKAASTARAHVRGAWPMAAVIADGGRYFVQVAACADLPRAEALVERLRQDGDPAEVHAL